MNFFSKEQESSNPPSRQPSRESEIMPLRSQLYHACLRDFTIGFADGLTVPFALTAGLSSIGSSRLVVTAGLAELFAGSLSMGLGAYLAASTKKCKETVKSILLRYGVSPSTSELVENEIDGQFLKDFEGEECKPWLSALIMGLSYFIGGLIPMIPYFALEVTKALFASIGITAFILLVFGAGKDYATTNDKYEAFKGAIKTLSVGATAAAASYGIVRAVNQSAIA